MAELLDSITLPNGNMLAIVATSASAGRSVGRPCHLRLVETDGSEYTHVRGRNVVAVFATHRIDGRCRGDRSKWHRTVEKLRQQMDREASNRSQDPQETGR